MKYTSYVLENFRYVMCGYTVRLLASVYTTVKSGNCLIIGARPIHNDTSEECYPKCRLGQCCVDGKCLCIDSETMEVADCECKLDHIVTYVRS